MEWETDRSLQVRMGLTLVCIAVMPLAFTLTMTAAVNHIIFPVAESLTDARLGTIQLDLRVVFLLTLVGLAIA